MGMIRVSQVCKSYKVYSNRWARLKDWIFPWGASNYNSKSVLHGVGFSVGSGEAVGIIGLNGAGKSTLLKLITGVSKPTSGSVDVTGSVAALLELGMGFHPDFTGRQNVYMAGQLLGMSRESIARLMPEIEEFADIGDYIDSPVRVYSSGMQMRLAFSVATAQRPDIIIVDEALSVGDSHFQHKSFDRIRKFKEQGSTLLIVSHDKQAIMSICDRAILLSGGTVAYEGAPEIVMDYYNALLADHQSQTIQQQLQADGSMQTISGTGEACISEVRLLDESDSPVEVAYVGQKLKLQVLVEVRTSLDQLVLGYGIKDRVGQQMFGTNTYHTKQVLSSVAAGSLLRFEVSFPANLGVGSYSVQLALTGNDSHLQNNYEWRERAVVFNVLNRDHASFVGSVWLESDIRISHD